MESDKDFELFFGGGFVLGDHEFRQLIGGAETIRAVEAIGEGIVGSESVVKPFCLEAQWKNLEAIFESGWDLRTSAMRFEVTRWSLLRSEKMGGSGFGF